MIDSTMDQGLSTSVRAVADLLRTSQAIFVKKLSNNDRDWAQLPNKHQAGPYVPPEQRDSGFFPELNIKDRAGSVIREAFFTTEWPQVDVRNQSRLVHYTSKGQETHLTGIPKTVFAELGPASWLVIGKVTSGNGDIWRCLTIDSTDDAAGFLVDVLELPLDFRAAIFETDQVQHRLEYQKEGFVRALLDALTAGKLIEFVSKHGTIPKTNELALMARQRFMLSSGLTQLNPFELNHPGDVIRRISREIEWAIFRDLQQKASIASLASMLLPSGHASTSPEKIIVAIAAGIQDIDALFLSAGQQRKSRAGYSFEHHIEAMLLDGRILFEKQVILESKRKPDFVLPSLARLRHPAHNKNSLVLSLKTTLRERWKQVGMELIGGRLFLATVDETVSANALDEMSSLDIALVVPESLLKSDVTEYTRHTNVIGFKTFFEDEVRIKRMPHWH